MAKVFKDLFVSIKGKEEDKRIISFLVSTGDIDRDMEILDPGGWKLKNYKKNPVFLWAHDHRGLPVARGVKFKNEEDGLLIDYQFATAEEYPFADTVYNLYKGGFLNAVSVGFIPLKWEDGDMEKGKFRRRYTEHELLEVSAVAVPSNYNALAQARDAGCIGEDEYVKVKSFLDTEENKQTYNCECIKCGYKMTSEKHCKDVPCPECGGEMRRAERPGPGRSINEDSEESKATEPTDGIVSFKEESAAGIDRTWDAAAAVKRLTTWAGGTEDMNLDKFQRGFAWHDAGQKDAVDSYQLAHHDIADGTIITVWKGVCNAMAALLGATGGVDIPDSDKEGVYAHLKQHYAQFGKEPPELRAFDQEAIKELFQDAGGDPPRQVIQELPAVKAMDDSNGKPNDGDIIDQILNGLKEEKNTTNELCAYITAAKQIQETKT